MLSQKLKSITNAFQKITCSAMGCATLGMAIMAALPIESPVAIITIISIAIGGCLGVVGVLSKEESALKSMTKTIADTTRGGLSLASRTLPLTWLVIEEENKKILAWVSVISYLTGAILDPMTQSPCLHKTAWKKWHDTFLETFGAFLNAFGFALLIDQTIHSVEETDLPLFDYIVLIAASLFVALGQGYQEYKKHHEKPDRALPLFHALTSGLNFAAVTNTLITTVLQFLPESDEPKARILLIPLSVIALLTFFIEFIYRGVKESDPHFKNYLEMFAEAGERSGFATQYYAWALTLTLATEENISNLYLIPIILLALTQFIDGAKLEKEKTKEIPEDNERKSFSQSMRTLITRLNPRGFCEKETPEEKTPLNTDRPSLQHA